MARAKKTLDEYHAELKSATRRYVAAVRKEFPVGCLCEIRFRSGDKPIVLPVDSVGYNGQLNFQASESLYSRFNRFHHEVTKVAQ